ncbi:MAG: type II toxin-antitoxin system RelE/ParE family toxin [Thermodesulfobacteriota bacterium]|nr:type II toxin-antitoxin system RelE/ParE family toxin [Thermodesulfobacteriota bacterium]
MKLFQMPRFKRHVKKLPRQFQQVVLDAVEDVVADPAAGEQKTGDLEGFRVHKFTMGRQLTLMAYRIEEDALVLYQVGPHENFYKNLKRYLREIGG